MAMVIAKRGQHIVKVSRDAYEKLFRQKGYRIEGEQKEEHIPAIDVEPDETDETDVDVETIPISEMNTKQLKEYAHKHNIDITKAKNLTEGRRIVQKAIRESKM